jgi:NADPH-dependent 2,4-dienoyl-CoA reductase/sulfur reductase-like enzyme
MQRIVVVGTSVAGVATAEAVRRLGFTGSIVLLGAERRQPYDRPPLTKAVLAGRQTADDCALRPDGWADQLEIDLRLGATAVALHARERTVELRSGERVATLEGGARVERVRLTDGAAIAADVVVVGLGAVPATGWLEGSGLRLGDGIVCDRFCRAAPGVVAAGDVARWEHPRLGSIRIEHWENAITQGRAAASSLLGAGGTEPYQPVPYVWSDQYEHKLQLVGAPRPGDAMTVIDGALDQRRFVALYVRDERVTAAIGLGRPRAIMRIRRLLRGDVSVADVTATLAENLPNDGLTESVRPATLALPLRAVPAASGEPAT